MGTKPTTTKNQHTEKNRRNKTELVNLKNMKQTRDQNYLCELIEQIHKLCNVGQLFNTLLHIAL